MRPPVRLALRADGIDLRLRGLSELLVQASLDGDGELVAAVDAAVGALGHSAGSGTPPFVKRLIRTRSLFGPVPAAYPVAGDHTALPGRPSGRVIAAVARLVRWAEPALAGPEPTRAEAEPARFDADPERVTRLLARYRAMRPAGMAHPGACRALTVPPELTWRTWFWTDAGPVLGVVPWTLPPARFEVMFGVHAGAHLDHLTLLAAEQGPDAAARLQFGDGLLIAEAVAMTVELALGARVPELRWVVRAGLVERLARLPRVAEWGPAAAPGSALMAQALRTADKEFVTLPALATAYTAGPVLLAERGFCHPLIPVTLRLTLRALSVELVSLVGQRRRQ